MLVHVFIVLFLLYSEKILQSFPIKAFPFSANSGNLTLESPSLAPVADPFYQREVLVVFAPTWSARKQCLSCVPAKTPIFPVIWVLREHLRLSDPHSSGHRVSRAPDSCATQSQIPRLPQLFKAALTRSSWATYPNHQQSILHIVGLTLQVVSGPCPLLDWPNWMNSRSSEVGVVGWVWVGR